MKNWLWGLLLCALVGCSSNDITPPENHAPLPHAVEIYEQPGPGESVPILFLYPDGLVNVTGVAFSFPYPKPQAYGNSLAFYTLRLNYRTRVTHGFTPGDVFADTLATLNDWWATPDTGVPDTFPAPVLLRQAFQVSVADDPNTVSLTAGCTFRLGAELDTAVTYRLLSRRIP